MRFARVSAVAAEAPLRDGPPELWAEIPKEHQPRMAAGLDAAIAEHRRRGGAPHVLTVTSFDWTVVDTTPDAVECAAAGAAWRALGNDDAAFTTRWEEGVWRPFFEGTVDYFTRVPNLWPHELVMLVREFPSLGEALPTLAWSRGHIEALAEALHASLPGDARGLPFWERATADSRIAGSWGAFHVQLGVEAEQRRGPSLDLMERLFPGCSDRCMRVDAEAHLCNADEWIGRYRPGFRQDVELHWERSVRRMKVVEGHRSLAASVVGESTVKHQEEAHANYLVAAGFAGDLAPQLPAVLRATTELRDAVRDYARAVVDAALDSPEGRVAMATQLAPITKRKIAHLR